ncbi:MAG: hypothetical protein KAS53_05095 [Candidatus Cloacimonetes bacterium]|nr:hypothetical protein [Candidatus Cloacimonadota bacterium]
MNSEIWNRIKQKKFRVLASYKEDMKDNFANFGKRSQKYSSFGPFYELYMYCFTIGFHSNKRVSLKSIKTDTFNSVFEWRNDHQIILKNFVTILICKEDIRNEIGFDFFSLEKLNINEINKIIDRLTNVFEEFANGGFEMLYNAYKKNPEAFYDFRSLFSFFNSIVKN